MSLSKEQQQDLNKIKEHLKKITLIIVQIFRLIITLSINNQIITQKIIKFYLEISDT